MIFYQKLWDGRLCRKKLYKKLKFDEEEQEKEDNPIIKEEMDFIGNIEMPRIRKRHDD